MTAPKTNLGHLYFETLRSLSDAAAQTIVDRGVPLALTVDTNGQLHLEDPDYADPMGLIGVFQGKNPMALSRIIFSELQAEIESRI